MALIESGAFGAFEWANMTTSLAHVKNLKLFLKKGDVAWYIITTFKVGY